MFLITRLIKILRWLISGAGFISSYSRLLAKLGHIWFVMQSEKRWIPPSPQQIKINSDGAEDSNSHKSSTGFICRNFTGWLLAATSFSYGNLDVLSAETLVLHEGLQAAKWLNLNDVIIQTDSKLAFQAILSTFSIFSWPWKIRGLVSDIRVLMETFFGFIDSHFPREANSCTIWIASRSKSWICTSFSIARPPSPLNDLLFVDWLFRPSHVSYS